MSFRLLDPPDALRPLFECCWEIKDEAPSREPQRILPDGRAEIIVHLAEPFEDFREGQWRTQSRCNFAGQLTGAMKIRPTGPVHTIGFRFHPHTAGLLVREAQALAGQVIPLTEIDRGLSSLEGLTRRTAATSTDKRVAAATRHSLQRSGNVTVSELARLAGLDVRQFERRFTRAVGIPPKFFCRVQRLQRVIAAMEQPGNAWVDAALSCGYYDQSHLVKDFRELAGDPPSLLLRQDSDLARHFLDRGQSLCRG